MPTRLLREGINDSERVDALSMAAEILYRRLMSVVDDYGRFDGRPARILAACFSLRLDRTTVADIASWLSECTAGDRPLITSYSIDGKPLIQINDFRQRTRSPSKYPAPPSTEPQPGSHDNRALADKRPSNDEQLTAHGGQMTVIRQTSAARARGRSETETETETETTRASGALPPAVGFDCEEGVRRLWEIYPAKGRTKRRDAERLYCERMSPLTDEQRAELHQRMEAPLRPGGKWRASSNWERGFVCSIFEYLRNDRWDEDPEPAESRSAAVTEPEYLDYTYGDPTAKSEAT